MCRLAVLLMAALLLAVPGFAAVLDVEAENVRKQGDRIEAYGNVIIAGEDMHLKANYVLYDTVTNDIWAVGDCELKEKGGEISAETLYYNAERRDFRLENGSVFVYSEPAVISGKKLTRYGMDQYEGEGIEFTPCLGSPPAWSIKAGSFNAPLEKYGRAYHARFQVRELPLLYFPYLYFPIKLQRQSGFLFPSFSQSSDYGFRAGIPYYQVLGRSMDATFTPNMLSSRGFLMTGEFRYRLDDLQAGEIYFESLPSDEKGGEELTGGVLTTIPDSRWLFRSNQSGGSLTWDVRLVSNPDYFRDIGPMYRNETIWQDTITTASGRGLEELVSRAQWNTSRKGFSANVSGLWKQDLTVPSNERTLQELPRLTLRMNQRSIPHTPAFFSSELNTVSVYSKDWIREVKNNAQALMSVPLTYYPYVTVTPSYTQYYRNAFITHNPGGFQNDATRQLFESRDRALTSNYTSSTFFEDNPGIFEDDSYHELWGRRDLSITTTLYSSRFLGGLYHQVVPTAAWTYFSRIGGNYDAGDVTDVFPEFLPEDVWNREFIMTLGVSNYIRDNTGRSLAELSISRVYDYLIKEWDYYEANFVFQPAPWISLRHLNRFGREPHPYATIEHWTQLSLSDSRGDELYVSEEYNKIDTKTALLGAKANLIKSLAARFEVEYDFLNDRYVNTRQGLTYTSQCWSIDFYREVDTSDINLPRDTTVGVSANLLGLGQVINTKRSVEGSTGQ